MDNVNPDFIQALALVFVLEGILPFIRPSLWRRFLTMIIGQSDKTMRIYGLISMLMGVGILYLAKFEIY
jgi:uncharacterized protein YjeT (DUF2065 family)